MRIEQYLKARGETQTSFARRSGVPLKTINDILLNGTRPRADTALLIINASREEPAPDGGTITLEDLAAP